MKKSCVRHKWTITGSYLLISGPHRVKRSKRRYYVVKYPRKCRECGKTGYTKKVKEFINE